MTTNAFIFSWDMRGIEAIIPITQYENYEKMECWYVIKGEKVPENTLPGIIHQLKMRARFNQQRHYEIYAIDGDESMDEEFWKAQWENYPQETADLVRSRGMKILGDSPNSRKKAVIT